MNRNKDVDGRDKPGHDAERAPIISKIGITRLDSFDLELYPVTLFEMMDTPVEREDELEAIVQPRAESYHLVICERAADEISGAGRC